YLFVAAGGAVIALVHGWIARFLRRASQGSPHKGLFYLSMLAFTIVFWPNLDFITNFRSIVWHMVAAMVVYHLVIRWFDRDRHESGPAYAYGSSPYLAYPA